MIFNSLEFLLFLPTVFFIYWIILKNNQKGQNIILLIASYFFYGWWDWRFLGLLALSTFLDYFYGFGVASTNKKKAKFYLWLSRVHLQTYVVDK